MSYRVSWRREMSWPTLWLSFSRIILNHSVCWLTYCDNATCWQDLCNHLLFSDTVSTKQAKYRWMEGWLQFGESERGLLQGTIVTFYWCDWRKPWKTSVRISSSPVDIRTMYIPNISVTLIPINSICSCSPSSNKNEVQVLWALTSSGSLVRCWIFDTECYWTPSLLQVL
jgi:hypothetical protein